MTQVTQKNKLKPNALHWTLDSTHNASPTPTLTNDEHIVNSDPEKEKGDDGSHIVELELEIEAQSEGATRGHANDTNSGQRDKDLARKRMSLNVVVAHVSFWRITVLTMDWLTI